MQENGRREIREPERTATGVTRVREWRDGVPAQAESLGTTRSGFRSALEWEGRGTLNLGYYKVAV